MTDTFIPFSRPLIGEEEIAEVVETLRSGWLTTGPKTREFEEEFAQYIGCRHAIAVNSCTAALHLALEAVGVGRDDIVITTPMTFAATAEVVRYFGARPVFVDIDAETLNISPEKLKATLCGLAAEEAGRVKAVIPVHMAGQPCAMDEILEVTCRHGLKVVEDAAHTLPARYRGRMVGTISDITCFSFYATKCITTGEGGMVATDSPEYADRMRIMSLHGISKDAWKRYAKDGSWYYEIVAPGYKYNMTDLAAAIGLAQLRKADALLAARERQAEMYDIAFRGLPGVILPGTLPEVLHSRHLYIIMLDLEHLRIDRAMFIEELKARGIMASVHFIPLHLHPYYRETYGFVPGDFPSASWAYERIVSLPLYPKMSDGETRRVIEVVNEVVRENLA